MSQVGKNFYERTNDYWREWCRYLSIPFEWQEAVIRAAITLKWSSFEESGAIIAAPTTSIPEAPKSQRNWDYRFCWLRDSYFVVHALNSLGVTRTMEGYLSYINIVAGSDDGYLQPVFGITMKATSMSVRYYRLRATTGWGQFGSEMAPTPRSRTTAMAALSSRARRVFSTSGSRS